LPFPAVALLGSGLYLPNREQTVQVSDTSKA